MPTASASRRFRLGLAPTRPPSAYGRIFDAACGGSLDVVEVHDAAAPAELMCYEELGLCGVGEGPRLLASGDTALGGRLPVNTSGGFLGADAAAMVVTILST